MRITFLKPTAPWARTAKTYSAPDRNKKENDYQLGTTFTWESVELDSLAHLHTELTTRRSEIAIYGEPSEELELIGGTCSRKTQNFGYPEAPTLHVFDLDKWDIPDKIFNRIKPRINDPASMERLVNALLRNEGFELLADAEKVIVLTSSMWDLDSLNAHIYVQFDEPVRVEAMREFAVSLAKIRGRVIMDPAIYKSVQPQFFTPPTCKGFKDPLQDYRIFLGKGSTYVRTAAWQKMCRSTIDNADWSVDTKVNTLPPIGKDWYDTIRNHINDENGINAPAYRAAAQMVQALGKAHVDQNLDKYAQQLHDAVWQTLREKHCTRGQSTADQRTYTVSRFQQYLRSALDKEFGEGVDSLLQLVNDAITKRDLDVLTSVPVVTAMAQLKSRHYPRFIGVEKRIKQEGLLNSTQLNKLIKIGVPINGDASASQLMKYTANSDGREAAENIIVDAVLAKYEYIEDNMGNKYVSIPAEDGSGSYRMVRCTGELANIFYVDGLEVSGNSVGDRFGRKALSKLVGQDLRAVGGIFHRVCIGYRIAMESSRIDAPTWLNIGEQSDGTHRAVQISHEGVTLHTYDDARVRWVHGVPPIRLASNEQIEERFGAGKSLKRYLAATLPKFITVSKQEYPKLIMWLVAVLANKTNAYIAELTGPTGTGKSTAADLMKDLVDPSNGLLGSGSDRLLHRDLGSSDFFNTLESEWVSILDNISKISVAQQDILCAVATGIKHSERILYTHSYTQRTIRRPLILTSLAPVVTRPDLRSRVIGIEISKPSYNLNFLRDWEYEKPFVLAALLEMTRDTLKIYNTVDAFPDGLNTRDVFLSCVYSAIEDYDTVDYAYVREFRLREAADMAHDSRFVNLLIAYLSILTEDYVEFRSRDLQPTLRRFAHEYAGKEFGDYVVNMTDTPESARGLTWEMTKNLDIISRVSDWEVEIVHQDYKDGKVFSFTRKDENKLDMVSSNGVDCKGLETFI